MICNAEGVYEKTLRQKDRISTILWKALMHQRGNLLFDMEGNLSGL